MLRLGSPGWPTIALGVGGRDSGNDSVPARDCCIYRRSIRKMKKKGLIVVGIAAICLLRAAVYFWGPGTAPQGQSPVVTLSEKDLPEFAKAFDAEPDVPRLVLLLSPT